MFDTIVLRSGESNKSAGISAGALCEALIFYQNVHLVVDHSTLRGLVDQLGLDNLRMLVDRRFCNITYLKEIAAVQSQDDSRGRQIHRFVGVQLVPEEKKSNADSMTRIRSRDYVIDALLRRDNSFPRGKVERLAERISVRGINDLTTKTDDTVLKGATRHLSDSKYMADVLRIAIEELVPDVILEKPVRVKAFEDNNGFVLETNLDFSSLNAIYAKHVSPEHSSLTQSYLLSWYLTSQMDIALACRYGTDISVPSLSSSIMRLSLRRILEKSVVHRENIRQFDDLVLSSVPSIREVINEGKMSFPEFLTILKSARRFKQWLRELPPDANLVTEYNREIAKQGWVGRLPSKSVRFATAAALGVVSGIALGNPVGTLLSVGWGAFDSFVLDRLIQGWKPNHFIEDRLVSAIKRKIVE